MSKKHALTVLLTLLIATGEVYANACATSPESNRPSVGLVLGGGGARGLAHVGILKRIEELNVPIDCIAGTSMGAVVGGLYASGMGADEIEKFVMNTQWEDLFSDLTRRKDRPLRRKSDDDLGLFGPRIGVGAGTSLLPGGAIAGQKISILLENTFATRVDVEHFDDMPIPFRAIATDLVNGNMVEFDRGNLAQAIRASMSVPGAFDPVNMVNPATGENVLTVDGGISRNLPVDVVRAMGADVVIAVNVEYPLLQAAELDNVLDIINQLTTLMVAGNTQTQLDLLNDQDVLISPDLDSSFASTAFERAPEAMDIGYQAALNEALLHTHSLSNADYQQWRDKVHLPPRPPASIAFINLNNQSRFSDGVILGLISTTVGEPLDTGKIEDDLSRVHALGFIRSAGYQVSRADGRTGIQIDIQPDQRGSDFIETGLDLTGSSRGTNVDLKMAYLKTDLDSRGSEFRGALQLGNEQGALAELYMPLDDGLNWIFRPQIKATRRNFTLFDSGGSALEEWELEEYAGELAIGREFGRHAGLFVGVNRYAGNARIKTGDPSSDNLRFNGGEWHVDAIYDRLDNRYLPSSGSFARLSYISSSTGLGADSDFEQAEFSLFSAVSRGRHTGWIGGQLNTSLDNDAPVYALYSSGGFLNMSGFERDELVGQHFGFAMLGYRYRLAESGLLPAYAGMTVEYGNASDRRGDVFGSGILNGSFYLGYDSPLGPLYLGLGWSEENSGVLFLKLGSLFGGQSIGRR